MANVTSQQCDQALVSEGRRVCLRRMGFVTSGPGIPRFRGGGSSVESTVGTKGYKDPKGNGVEETAAPVRRDEAQARGPAGRL